MNDGHALSDAMPAKAGRISDAAGSSLGTQTNEANAQEMAAV
ncbi:hypothetical protein ACTVH1_17645 [Gluconobacter cerinus]